MDSLFASRITEIKTHKIRERLEVPPDAGLISFATSLPAKELFPVKDIEESTKDAFERWQDSALQYAQSEGIPSLREKIANRVNTKFMTKFDSNNICISTGSQHGFDIVGKLFLNEGDIVLHEPPIPLSVLMAYSNYGVDFVEIASDEHGMLIEDVESALRLEKRVKMIYICPDFMRPSGKSWDIERRKAFIETISDFDVVVVEDITFSDFRFEGEHIPSVASLDSKGKVILIGSFSRIFCPGVRLGWLGANKEFMKHIRKVKCASDLSSSTLDQYILDCYLEKHDIEDHVQKLICLYRERRDLLDSAMRENFPRAAIYSKPEGGLYTWVRMEGLNARALLEKCIEQHVAFVPGDSFYSRGGGDNMFRLSITSLPMERIRAGIKRIAKGLSNLGFHPPTRVTINPQAYLELDKDEQKKVLIS